jgi:hypothetical protein
LSRHGFLKVKVHSSFIHVSSERWVLMKHGIIQGGLLGESAKRVKILPNLEGGGEPLRAKVDGGWCLIA